MPTSADARVGTFNLTATAGTTVGLATTWLQAGVAYSLVGKTVVIYEGGRVDPDPTDFTGATAYPATIATNTATVAAFVVPAVSTQRALRVTLDGELVGLGFLKPSRVGSPNPDVDLTVNVEDIAITFDFLGAPGTGTWDGELSVMSYGADETGATESGTALAATFAAAVATRIVDPAGSNVRVGRAIITLPPGTFLVSTAEALMTELVAGQRMTGIVFRGSGKHATQIIVDTNVGTGALARNADQFLEVVFEDIEFASLAAVDAVSKPTFLLSDSEGGAKDFHFNRCRWSGFWAAGIQLTGTDSNAQFSFSECTIRNAGFANGFLRAVSADSAVNFVNYWFDRCRFYFTGGYFVKAEGYLGHIHASDSLIACEVTDLPVTLFHLGQANDNNASFLSIDGVYSELHQDGQMFLESHWNQGTINVTNTSWNGGATGDFDPLTSTSVKIYNDLAGTSNIRFVGVGSKGKHQYHYGTSISTGPTNVFYDACDFRGASQASDVIEYVATGGQHANRPRVEFTARNVFRGGSITIERPAQVYGWERARAANPKLHRATFKSVRGDLIITPTDDNFLPSVALPMGAVVLAAEMLVLSGSDPSTTWAFTIKSAGGTPVTLATFDAGGDAIAVGVHRRVANINHICNTESKRTLTLSTTYAGGTAKIAYIGVEYLA